MCAQGSIILPDLYVLSTDDKRSEKDISCTTDMSDNTLPVHLCFDVEYFAAVQCFLLISVKYVSGF